MEKIRHAWTMHWRLIILTLALVIVLISIYSFRSIIFPFALGLIMAYVFRPLLLWAERKLPVSQRLFSTRRIALIAGLYMLVLVVMGALGFYVYSAIISSISGIVSNAPEYTSSAFLAFTNWLESVRYWFPLEMQSQVDGYLTEFGTLLGNTIKSIFTNGIVLIPTTIGFIAGMAVFPVFLFYLLKDWEKLGESLHSTIPSGLRGHVQNIYRIFERVIGRYMRAQLFCGFIVSAMSLVGLIILGIPFAPALAVFAGIMEMVPVIGPWIGGITAAVVTLALIPQQTVWVVVLFIAIQLIENNLLVPRIQGAYLKIHPAVIILLLVVGAHFAGIWGMIAAVPLTAVIMEIYRYMYRAAQAEDDEAKILELIKD